MKKSLQLLLLISVMLLGYHAKAQLSGTYTIDSSLTATTTNFQSLASAVASLTNQGVSGPVVFNIAAGTYAGFVSIPAITGASATNTITFDGGTGNASSRIIAYSATASASRYTVQINNSPYISLRNLTIQANGTTYGWGIHIMGASHGCKIKNCIIDISGGATSTSANFSGIVISNSATSATTGARIDSVEIDSNTINYGYYAIAAAGITSNLSLNNTFRKNIISNTYNSGIYLLDQLGTSIENNTITFRNGVTSGTGISLQPSSVITITGANTHRIIGNRIINPGRIGILVSGLCTDTIQGGLIANNMIGGGFNNTTSSSGIFINRSNSWNVWNNSVNADLGSATSAVSAALNINEASKHIAVYNNILACSKMGGPLPLYVGDSTSIDSMDYNHFYKADTTEGIIYIGKTCTLYDYKGAAGFNANSIFARLNFVDSTNLDIRTGCINGKFLPGLTTDINGTTRNNPPDIGAMETTGVADNIELLQVKPQIPFMAGVQDIVVTVKNSGNNYLSNYWISYKLDADPVVTTQFFGLNTCDTTSLFFSSVNFTNGTHTLLVYCSDPNGNIDGDRSNDTLKLTLYTALAGNYTINNSLPTGGTNFNTFNDAVNALRGGVTAPVVFNVAAGTYNRRVVIPNVPGASAMNTITFDGGTGNAATRILTYAAAGSDDRHTLQINNASYIELRNLTIEATGSTYGWCINILGKSNGCKIKNCAITVRGVGATVTTYKEFNGIIINNNPTDLASGNFVGGKACNLEIDSNIITAGATGIYQIGYSEGFATDNKFRYNIITNMNNTGIWVQRLVNTEIIGNNITMRTPALQSSGIVYEINRIGFHKILGNKITNAGVYGITIRNSYGTPNMKGLLANNMIGGKFQNTTSSMLGIEFDQSSYWNIWQNSVLMDAVGTNTNNVVTGIHIRSGNNNMGFSIYNNIFYHTKGALGHALRIETAANVDSMDYNQIYKTNAQGDAVYIEGSSVSLANVIGYSGFNTHSIVTLPSFKNDTNLHITKTYNNGIALPGITHDIDGNIRNNPPDIGADEATPLFNDLEILKITPPQKPFVSGTHDLRVLIANNGNNPISSFTVSHTLNNGLVVSLPYAGSALNPEDTTTVTFTGVNFAHGTNEILVYTSDPNALPDSDKTNDTLRLSATTVLNGDYTIDNTLPTGGTNFNNFTAASTGLQQGGISGPVRFNVAAGAFFEQVVIPAVTGVSAVNTITFDGGEGNASTRVLLWFATGADSRHTLQILNSPYIEMRNLTIQSTGNTYGWPIHIMGTGSLNTKIKKCIIEIIGAGITSTSTNYAGIVINNSSSSETTGGAVNQTIIDSNIINYGAYGIIQTGTSSGLALNSKFRNNSIKNAYSYGIYLGYNANAQIANNDITLRTATNSTGIYLTNCTNYAGDTMSIVNNKITSAGQYGIRIASSPANTASKGLLANNVIGGNFRNTNSYGIHLMTSGYWNILHNSVSLDNTGTASAPYAALYISGGSGISVYNNVFSASGGQMAMNIADAVSIANCDYNNLHTSGTMLVQYNSINYSNITAWKNSGIRLDSHSVSYRPGYLSRTDLTPDVNDSASWSLNGRGMHLPTALSGTDINGNQHPATLSEGVPDIGAYEFTPVSIPPLASSTGSLAADSTQIFLFAGDTVAKIKWRTGGIPDNIEVRQYSGVTPPGVGTPQKFMYFYTDLQGSGNIPNYDIDLYYHDNWTGTIPTESNIRLSQQINFIGASSVNTILNTIKGQNVTGSSWFTGADLINPLPVNLLSFNAVSADKNVLLTWATAGESNANSFIVEYSIDNTNWDETGRVKAAGNTTSQSRYQLTDINAFAKGNTLFYRLKMVDNDGTYAYSNTVSVSLKTSLAGKIIVYPNPFSGNITIETDSEKEGTAQYQLKDITGKDIGAPATQQLIKGKNGLQMNTAELDPGIYFLSIDTNGITQTIKVIKH